MTRDEMQKVMDQVFNECEALREAGQAEYAGGEDTFGNFNRLAQRLGVDRKQVLLTYLAKHQDGVDSYVRGHKSQREDVRGRINDQIVYLCLLRGMIEEEEEQSAALNAETQESRGNYLPFAHSFKAKEFDVAFCVHCGKHEADQIHNGSLA
jgi:hypothetical protein